MAGPRGMLIVFEGLDRSGKSTQCENLVKTLRDRGDSVEHVRFPNRATPIGLMINNYLTGQTEQDDHVIHLLFSANRWEAAKSIEQHIHAGTTVVIDRYSYSGAVYSAAKQIPSMDLDWCRQAEVGLPRPDICVFLDISSEEASKRGGFGTERYEKKDLQDRVRQLYAELRTHDDEREDIVVIDAGRAVDDVGDDILHAVDEAKKKLSVNAGLRRMRAW